MARVKCACLDERASELGIERTGNAEIADSVVSSATPGSTSAVVSRLIAADKEIPRHELDGE